MGLYFEKVYKYLKIVYIQNCLIDIEFMEFFVFLVFIQLNYLRSRLEMQIGRKFSFLIFFIFLDIFSYR